jgi:cholesterol transport system auxiliary component
MIAPSVWCFRRPLRWLAIVLATVLAGGGLASCGGILSEPPQRKLYQVRPSASFTAPLRRSSAQLLIALPNAPAGLDTERIALSRSSLSLDYFADAQWTDRASLLVQSALLEGFEKSGAVPAVGRDSAGLRADFILETDLREFAAIYDSPTGPPRVAVAFNVKLIKIPERKIIGVHSFTRQQPAAADTIPEIVRAFDTALGGAVEEAVRWAVGNPALSSGRASLF